MMQRTAASGTNATTKALWYIRPRASGTRGDDRGGTGSSRKFQESSNEGWRMLWRGLARATLALSILVVLSFPSAASAAPTEGPSGPAFYTPPAPAPTGSPGELVWYRPATVDLNVTLPAVKAWTVLYQSTDEHGQPDWVTGTVIVPSSKWSG